MRLLLSIADSNRQGLSDASHQAAGPAQPRVSDGAAAPSHGWVRPGARTQATRSAAVQAHMWQLLEQQASLPLPGDGAQSMLARLHRRATGTGALQPPPTTDEVHQALGAIGQTVGAHPSVRLLLAACWFLHATDMPTSIPGVHFCVPPSL